MKNLLQTKSITRLDIYERKVKSRDTTFNGDGFKEDQSVNLIFELCDMNLILELFDMIYYDGFQSNFLLKYQTQVEDLKNFLS